MKRFFADWRQVTKEFGAKAILDALLGAFLFSTLVMGPIYVILVEVLIVYFYRVYTLAVLIVVAILFHDLLFHRLAKRALILKKPETQALVGRAIFWQSVAIAIVLLVLGLIVLLVMIPIWMV